jgi:hypothetical protein
MISRHRFSWRGWRGRPVLGGDRVRSDQAGSAGVRRHGPPLATVALCKPAEGTTDRRRGTMRVASRSSADRRRLMSIQGSIEEGRQDSGVAGGARWRCLFVETDFDAGALSADLRSTAKPGAWPVAIIRLMPSALGRFEAPCARPGPYSRPLRTTRPKNPGATRRDGPRVANSRLNRRHPNHNIDVLSSSAVSQASETGFRA